MGCLYPLVKTPPLWIFSSTTILPSKMMMMMVVVVVAVVSPANPTTEFYFFINMTLLKIKKCSMYIIIFASYYFLSGLTPI